MGQGASSKALDLRVLILTHLCALPSTDADYSTGRGRRLRRAAGAGPFL